MWGLDIFFTHDLCAHILSHILQVWHQNVSLKEEPRKENSGHFLLWDICINDDRD
jgi:hypothetical protein